MRLFDFLFYCLYRVLKLIPRQGVKNEDVAYTLYFVLLATNTGTLLLFLKDVTPRDFFESNPLVAKLVFLLAFIFWYFFCRYYFSKKGNDQRIVSSLDLKYNEGNKQVIIIGILYTFFSFFLFITLASFLSRIKH